MSQYLAAIIARRGSLSLRRNAEAFIEINPKDAKRLNLKWEEKL